MRAKIVGSFFLFGIISLVSSSREKESITRGQFSHSKIKREDSGQGDSPSSGGNGGASESSPSSSGSDNPATPTSTPDQHLDVGQVKVASQTDSCNGVLLEPTFVLTVATCVYPNHTAGPYEDITFEMGAETKPVQKVFRNPHWHLTGERKENFALLQLGQPMPFVNQKRLTSMMWSSYALEDIGDSYIATPDSTSCVPASKAGRAEVIRHVSNDIITLSCTNKGTMDPGSPIYRLIDDTPVIFGVYFGHCTSGSLDRETSGSCGARISKHVFQDFCRTAKAESVDLTDCESQLLDAMNTNFPTTVFTKKGYDAVTERDSNVKSVLLAYHSSASEYFQSFVEDLETIQRLKSVYDKFKIAVVDVNLLPFQVKAVPFIEYRTKSSDSYIAYNDEYDFTSFKKFMDFFSKVGAPPAGTTSFLQVLRSATSLRGELADQSPPVQSHLQPQSGGEKFTGSIKCDSSAGYVLIPDQKCACLPTHFGSGTGESGNCQELKAVLQANCKYQVSGESSSKTYEEILAAIANNASWCSNYKNVFAHLTKQDSESVTVSGEELTPEHCAEAIDEIAACALPDRALPLHDGYHNGTISNEDTFNLRNIVNTKTSSLPPGYLDNFQEQTSPGPMTYPPNTHFVTVQGEGDQQQAKPYSVVFDGNRGIPTLVGYKLTNADMTALNRKKRLVRNGWSRPNNLRHVRIGSNKLYLQRGGKTEPEAVKEGQLNPMQMQSFSETTMPLTFNHLNAFPMFSDFSNGVWRKYERKIFDYSKTRCKAKDASSKFYVISGVSDYELKAGGTNAFLTPANYWPVAYKGAVPQPNGSPNLEAGVESVIQPKSVWTVGCCSWTESGAIKGESVSIWANNKPRGVPKYENQPDLTTLARRLYPGKPCLKFFPANAECNSPEFHYTLQP